ncbi:MAG: serine acetyltransferase [bacterium]|jgi:serine O-acetyltransferase
MNDPQITPILDEACEQFGDGRIDFDAILEAVCAPGDVPGNPAGKNFRGHPRPSRSSVHECVEMLRSVLFPGYFGYGQLTERTIRAYVLTTLDRALRLLQEQVMRALCFECEKDFATCGKCVPDSRDMVVAFANRLPEVRRILSTDAQASYDYDPATTIRDEPVFCYPGMFAVTNYRMAHELAVLGVPLIPRIMTEYAHDITGIDIHPAAEIGESFFIDHGTGVVIGATCIIGNRVRLYQGVTLGVKNFELDERGFPVKGVPRHPILEDDVVIYSNTSVLGRIRIGKGSVVAANVRLTTDVPPGSIVYPAAVRVKVVDPKTGLPAGVAGESDG